MNRSLVEHRILQACTPSSGVVNIHLLGEMAPPIDVIASEAKQSHWLRDPKPRLLRCFASRNDNLSA